MKNKFLFELGTEEIPADMIPPAVEQLKTAFQNLLQGQGLAWESMVGYATPRRLSLVVEGLPARQPDRQEVVLGPSVAVGRDEQGQPTAAARGFARKMGVPVEELQVQETEKGAYLSVQLEKKGRPTPTLLGESLAEVLRSFSWPKNMIWTESGFQFIRPLRWFVTLWNDEVVEFEFEGVRSGRTTRGHRFLGKPSVPVPDVDHYAGLLEENFVVVDPQKRRHWIEEGLLRAAGDGLKVRPDPELLEQVVYLNEYPQVLKGSFDPSFLEIPQEVLVTVMRHHQKYFCLVNPAGELEPGFLTVINTRSDPDGSIRRGHEKVLKARLEDAAFFWDSDRKISLQERREQLQEVLFQEKLGSYWEKSERLQGLCRRLHPGSDLQRAAELCKADLTSGMVREFPELQGIMGGLYARAEGYPEKVWKSIYEHYRPVSLEEPSPSTVEGAVLSVADKVDTVVGCFGVGIVPSGSSDPFALRRQGQALVKVLLDHRLQISLEDLVRAAADQFTRVELRKETVEEVLDFLLQRVRFLLHSRGIPQDVLKAVLAAGVRYVHDALERAQALSAILEEPDFEALALAYKRVRNILAGQRPRREALVEEDLVEPEERQLYEAFCQLKPKVDECLAQGEYLLALKELARLRGALDRFFDQVLVLAQEEALKENRLRLLEEISLLFLSIADISEIVQQGDSR